MSRIPRFGPKVGSGFPGVSGSRRVVRCEVLCLFLIPGLLTGVL